VEIECILHNFSLFAIFLPKITRNNFAQFFETQCRNHSTINRTTHPLPGHCSNAYLLRVIDASLQKRLAYLCGLLLSIFIVSSIDYYLVCSLLIHKICALCGIFSAISVLLTTENSDDLGIRVPDRSRSLKDTPVNSSRIISY